MEQDKSSRVRWSPQEWATLGAEFARHVSASRSKLDALRSAQLVLPEDRRREVATWSQVSQRLDPYLAAIPPSSTMGESQLARTVSSACLPVASEPEPMAAPTPEPTPEPAQQASSVYFVDSNAIKAVIQKQIAEAWEEVVAPRLEAIYRRLAAVSATPATESASAEIRVLLAGLTPDVSKRLTMVMPESMTVQTWRPPQTQSSLGTMAKGSNVAVVPEGCEDELLEFLRANGDPRIVSYAPGGAVTRVMSRIMG